MLPKGDIHLVGIVLVLGVLVVILMKIREIIG